MKRYLFIMRRPPHGGGHVQEALDMLLTAAAFDREISVLFLDDGVFQLKAGQNPQALSLRDTAGIIGALEIYDVRDLHVELESLLASGLDAADLIAPARIIPRAEVGRFMRGFDVIVPD